jgi:hypothetical protein
LLARKGTKFDFFEAQGARDSADPAVIALKAFKIGGRKQTCDDWPSKEMRNSHVRGQARWSCALIPRHGGNKFVLRSAGDGGEDV